MSLNGLLSMLEWKHIRHGETWALLNPQGVAECYRLSWVLVPVGETLLGSRSFTHVIKLRWGHWGRPWPTGLVSLQEEEVKTETGTDWWPCEDGGKDGGEASTSPRTPRITCSPQKLAERMGQILPWTSRRSQPCPNLHLRRLVARTEWEWVPVVLSASGFVMDKLKPWGSIIHGVFRF